MQMQYRKNKQFFFLILRVKGVPQQLRKLWKTGSQWHQPLSPTKIFTRPRSLPWGFAELP
jgi:hypothetical protein